MYSKNSYEVVLDENLVIFDWLGHQMAPPHYNALPIEEGEVACILLQAKGVGGAFVIEVIFVDLEGCLGKPSTQNIKSVLNYIVDQYPFFNRYYIHSSGMFYSFNSGMGSFSEIPFSHVPRNWFCESEGL